MTKIKIGMRIGKNMVKKYGTYFVIAIVLVLGITLRTQMYSGYLTYVDSYKYLLNADSFNQETSQQYAEEKSHPQSKWGYSLAIALVNAPLQKTGDGLAQIARNLNFVISMLIGLLLLVYLKRAKFISFFIFLSPLFVSYSSYVISEYLTLLVLFLSVIIVSRISVREVENKWDLKTTLLSVYLAVFLAFLPVVRMEMFVPAVLLIVYLFWKNWRSGFVVWIGMNVIYWIIIYGISVHMGQPESIVTYMTRFITGTFSLQLLVLAVAFWLYLVKLQKNYHRVVYILSALYSIWFVMGLRYSFTFKNAYTMDSILFIFLALSFLVITVYGYKRSIKTSALFDTLLISLFSLSWIYYIFDTSIDRYAITLFGLMLLAIGTFINETDILHTITKNFCDKARGLQSGTRFSRAFGVMVKDSSNFIKIAHYMVPAVLILGYIGFAFAFTAKYQPRKADYQQQLIKAIGEVKTENKVMTTEYMYLTYLYYYHKTPTVIDRSFFYSMKKGDFIIADTSLRTTNSVIYDAIILNPGKFSQVKRVTPEYPFNFNEGILDNQGDTMLVEVK